MPPISESASLTGACAGQGFSDWGRPYFSSSLPDFFCNFMLWCIPIWFSGSADCAHHARQKRAPSAKSAAKLQNECPITLDWFWKNAKKISFLLKIVHFGPTFSSKPGVIYARNDLLREFFAPNVQILLDIFFVPFATRQCRASFFVHCVRI